MTNPLPHFAPLIDRVKYAPETVKPEEVEDLCLLLQKFVTLIDDHTDGKIGATKLIKNLVALRNDIEY